MSVNFFRFSTNLTGYKVLKVPFDMTKVDSRFPDVTSPPSWVHLNLKGFLLKIKTSLRFSGFKFVVEKIVTKNVNYM